MLSRGKRVHRIEVPHSAEGWGMQWDGAALRQRIRVCHPDIF